MPLPRPSSEHTWCCKHGEIRTSVRIRRQNRNETSTTTPTVWQLIWSGLIWSDRSRGTVLHSNLGIAASRLCRLLLDPKDSSRATSKCLMTGQRRSFGNNQLHGLSLSTWHRSLVSMGEVFNYGNACNFISNSQPEVTHWKVLCCSKKIIAKSASHTSAVFDFLNSSLWQVVFNY